MDIERQRMEPITRITSELFVGNIMSIQSPESFRAMGIRAVVSVNNALKGVRASDLGVKYLRNFNLIDGPGNDIRIFEKAVDTALNFGDPKKGPVLIQCQAGRSRSVAVAAAYLMIRDDISATEACARLARVRPININPALRALLNHFEPDILDAPLLRRPTK